MPGPTTTSPFMLLVLPVPGVEVGPLWASELVTALGLLVDAHDHSTDKGVKVTPAGLDINNDLPFAGNAASGLRAVLFDTQTAEVTDTSSLYFLDNELFVVDAVGNQVQVTKDGALDFDFASVGAITGMVNGAAVTYVDGSKTFAFTQSVAGKLAGLIAGDLTFSDESVNNGQGVRLRAPAGLVATYTLTFPAALPSSTSKVPVVGTTGTMTFSDALSLASVTLSGALTAVTGVFSGAISGASAAIVGAVTAASATVTGAISGATGVFSGIVSALQFRPSADFQNPDGTTVFDAQKRNLCKGYASMNADGTMNAGGLNNQTGAKLATGKYSLVFYAGWRATGAAEPVAIVTPRGTDFTDPLDCYMVSHYASVGGGGLWIQVDVSITKSGKPSTGTDPAFADHDFNVVLF